MSKSRLLVTLTIIALIAGCASYDHHHNRSSGAKTSADIRVHAIDATTDQETVEVQARNGTLPSTLHWKTDDPAKTLSIEFTDSGQQCVTDLSCVKDACTANSNVNFHGSAPLRCHYRTSLNGGAVTHDPVIIIDNCCP